MTYITGTARHSSKTVGTKKITMVDIQVQDNTSTSSVSTLKPRRCPFYL